MALSPEFQLIAACAIWPPSDRRTQAIEAAASERINWPRFLRITKRQQVVGLVHEGLNRMQLQVPPEIALELGVEAVRLARENLMTTREALRLQSLFDDADVPVLFLKGASLALLAFGNLGLRTGKDIDLLVSLEQLTAATALMERAGYIRTDPSPNISEAHVGLIMPLRKDFGFVHQATGTRAELHWRLFVNPHALDTSSVRAESQIVPITGTMGLRTLAKEDLFAYICMHGALHFWNRLKWLADINAFLASMPNDAVESLFRAAEARGAGRAAAQALLLCRMLFQTPLPPLLRVTSNNSVTMRWLVATALSAMTTGQGEDDLHDVRFGTTRGSVSTILLSRSWRYRLAELGIQMTNPTDVLNFPLPRPLRFLYPALRVPLWLWRHARH